MSSEAVVEARGLTKKFGEVQALRGIDLTVPAGSIFGLLGPNGAGKTTTTRILGTLEHADGGTARVLGHDVAREPGRVREGIGYVPQELSADRYLTARENLRLFADLYHLPPAERARRIDELLALLGLVEQADRQVKTFSGGMKKKLDVACGLLHAPRLLFLDEPSLGLDVQIRRALWDHVLELRQRGTTVLLCTNYMDEADALCDRVAIVSQGKVVACDTPQALRAGLGGDVVSVELKDPGSIEPAEKAVRSLALVRSAWSGKGQLHMTVEANETALPAILRALHEAKVELAGASYHRPGLEEVFLKHTGHRFAEELGTSGPPKPRRG